MKLEELWRYPVKGMRGERLERAQLAEDGVPGDRRIRILNGRKRITERTVPRLLGLQASVGEDGEPTIEGIRWDEPEALATVRELVGEKARMRSEDGVDRFDAAPLHIVTDGAVGALGEDHRRFRPNLVISGVDGLSERDWIGSRLRIGSAELLVREHCDRCKTTTIDPDTFEITPAILARINEEFDTFMGIYCEVAVPGEIAVSDTVELV